jgi:Lon protease-like protein
MTLRIPIFPLPGVVFFPETALPLHIFEPRYREMLADALAGDRILGVQLLDPAGRPDAAGRPAVHEIGCAGEIADHETLPDGRSNILLHGVFRYRIEREIPGEKPYRIAEVTEHPIARLRTGTPAPGERRERLLADVGRLADAVGRSQAKEFPPGLSDEGVVNEILTRLGIDADDGYRLLTMDALDERYDWAAQLIESMQRRLDLLAPFRPPNVEPRWN